MRKRLDEKKYIRFNLKNTMLCTLCSSHAQIHAHETMNFNHNFHNFKDKISWPYSIVFLLNSRRRIFLIATCFTAIYFVISFIYFTFFVWEQVCFFLMLFLEPFPLSLNSIPIFSVGENLQKTGTRVWSHMTLLRWRRK